MKKILTVVALALLAATAALAGDSNRVGGTLAREFARPSDFTDQENYRTVAGASYERLFSKVVGLRLDAFRATNVSDSWQGSADLALHARYLAFQAGVGYDDPTRQYLGNVGFGFDHCSGHYCGESVLRYYREIDRGDETEGSKLAFGDAYHLSLTLGFGVRW